MSDIIPFDRRSPGTAGQVETLSPQVRRLIAPNPGPFTFTGTCTYIVGHGQVAVIDPGPDDPFHANALLDALQGETVSAILVTHTHRDHSTAARALVEATGAPTYGGGPHRSARKLFVGEKNRLDASADKDFVPTVQLRDGDRVTGDGWTLETIETPGHCANHLAFALLGSGGLFSGDHVMAWSTSIVAPPDGTIGDYMRSLEKLLGRDETVYWPGHGAILPEPQRFVRALMHHRRMREASIVGAISAGVATVPAIVARVYAGLDPKLVGAASLNTLAHLEDLVERGLVETDGSPALEGSYRASASAGAGS